MTQNTLKLHKMTYGNKIYKKDKSVTDRPTNRRTDGQSGVQSRVHATKNRKKDRKNKKKNKRLTKRDDLMTKKTIEGG